MPTSAPSSAEKEKGCVFGDVAFGDLFAVDEEDALAAGAGFGGVRDEFVFDRVLAGGEAVAGDVGALPGAEVVVVVVELSVLHVQRPAAEGAGLGDDDAVRVVVRQLEAAVIVWGRF